MLICAIDGQLTMSLLVKRADFACKRVNTDADITNWVIVYVCQRQNYMPNSAKKLSTDFPLFLEATFLEGTFLESLLTAVVEVFAFTADLAFVEVVVVFLIGFLAA